MATYYAIGATSASLTTLSNWKPNRDGSGSSPGSFANTDTYIIEQAPSSAPTSAWTGTLGEVLDLIVTYGGKVGSAGNPLKFAVAGSFIVNHGGTQSQYYCPVSASANEIWTRARIERTGGLGAKVVLGGAASGQCNDLAIAAGCMVEINENLLIKATDGEFRCAEGSNVDIGGTTTIPIGIVAGQVSGCTRPFTALDVEKTGIVKTTGSGAAITYAKVRGRLLHHAAGTIAKSEVLPGGVATAAGSPYRPTISARKLWGNANNFSDNSAIVDAASDDVVAIPIGK